MDSVVTSLIIKSLYNQLSKLYEWYNESCDEVQRHRYCQNMENVLEKIVAEWHRLENPHGFYNEVLLYEYLSMSDMQDWQYGLEKFRRGWSWYDTCTKMS